MIEILAWCAVVLLRIYGGALAGKGLSMPNRWCARLACWRPLTRGRFYCDRHQP